MSRRHGNSAIISVGDKRRTGLDGRPISYGTHAAFASFKRDFDRRLQAAGVHQLKPKNLKPRHIETVRAFVRLIDRRYLVPRTNAELGFGRRVYVRSESRAVVLGAVHLERVTCPYVMASLKLQREFGLRREEAMKMQPESADSGDKLVLEASWCKGRRERIVPIRTEAQRAVLDEAKDLAATTEKGSLIPTEKYVQQKHRFEYQCRKAGLHGSHGLRHEYAQQRFQELAGFACPLAGGPTRKDMTPDMRRANYEARLEVARELGHGRADVTINYLGR